MRRSSVLLRSQDVDCGTMYVGQEPGVEAIEQPWVEQRRTPQFQCVLLDHVLGTVNVTKDAQCQTNGSPARAIIERQQGRGVRSFPPPLERGQIEIGRGLRAVR